MSLTTASSQTFEPGKRFDRWLLRRIVRRRGITTLPRTFEYRHIFVLPSMFGVGFGTVLAATAIGALNFNNNLALLLAFILISISLMTMFLAYRNQAGLSVLKIAAEPVFAGENALFQVLIRNTESRNRYAICSRWNTATEAHEGGVGDCRDFLPEETLKLNLKCETWKRGRLKMQAFAIENRFPFGLFKAWSILVPEAECLVYPEPAHNPPPLPRTGRGDHGKAQKGDGEHFHGLREYQPGDSLRRIAWRTSARHQKLFTREMEAPREEACEFNWYLTPARDVEEKLSIMTAWILRAEHHQIPYSLEMPTEALPADLGEEHRAACLKILALHEG
ncbi:MAG TPA: DUF58 domain-containing protein [Xanthomonadales bacterium]|nr:DUF58 domain-containing protein [Xanthomonadales bacterium]